MTKPRLRFLGPTVAARDLRTARPAPKTVEPFYRSAEWRELSTAVVKERGKRCEKCGRTGCRMFVDHIVELKDGGDPLDRRNLQVLCGACHTAKTARVRAARMAAVHRPEA